MKELGISVIGTGLCGKGMLADSVIKKEVSIFLEQEKKIQEELNVISRGIMPAFKFSTSSGNTLRNMRRNNKVSRIKRKRIQ